MDNLYCPHLGALFLAVKTQIMTYVVVAESLASPLAQLFDIQVSTPDLLGCQAVLLTFPKKSDSITKIFTRKMAKWLTKSQIKKRKCSKIVQFVKEHYLVRNDLDEIWHNFVEQQVSSNLELVLLTSCHHGWMSYQRIQFELFTEIWEIHPPFFLYLARILVSDWMNFSMK